MPSDRTRSSPQRSVLDFDDPGSAAAFGGLPYAGQDAVLDDGTIVSVSIRSVGPLQMEMAIPGRPPRVIGSDRISIDRVSVSRKKRPMPPPDGVLVVSSLGRLDASLMPTGVSEKVLGAAEFVNLGPSLSMESASDISALVDFAQTTRMVISSPEWFRDEVVFASAIVRLVASGVVCAVVGLPAGPLVGVDDRLKEALGCDLELLLEDDLEWAATMARQSRGVWLRHDTQIRWHETEEGWAPFVEAPPIPSVSVLLASMRPKRVPEVLRQIGGQRTVEAEVVVGLHTEDRASVATVEAAMRDVGIGGTVARFDPALPLGAMLNVMAERASGAFVTKWDDDDLYGPHHLEDLVVALRHSGSDLIGKRAEFVYFADANETIVRETRGAERKAAANVAGATLFTSRELFLAVGGFAPIPRAVDFQLQRRYRSLGLEVYRTHGFGFVVVRRPGAHTWSVSDEVLRERAERVWSGVPEIADVFPYDG